MALKRGGLGRGLDSLIPDRKKDQTAKQTAHSKEESKAPKKVSAKKAGTKKKKKPETEDGITLQSKKEKSSENNVNEPAFSNDLLKKNDETGIEADRVSDISENMSYDQDYNINIDPEKTDSPVREAETASVSVSENSDYSDHKERAEAEEISSVSAESTEIKQELSDYQDGEMSFSEGEERPISQNESKEKVLLININLVEPNREQPRKKFREEGIEELASSIAQYGIIQPLLVQKRADYYEIIAGERRWRAARKAGLKEVPVILKDYSEKEAVEISLIENIQREDLNPIEEALAYERLINEFEMTQEQVAGRVSKSRSAVTNSLRLLKLESDIRGMLISGELTEGHARAILGLPDPEAQKSLAERVVKDKLSVRDTEKIVKKLMSDIVRKAKKRDYQKEAVLSNLSEQLKTILGTKVSIHEGARHKGKIEIEYYSDDELNRIFEMLQSLK